MKDKDGNPIVALPPKHFSVEMLELSEAEREIYTAIYQNAKSKFLQYEKEGTVLTNVYGWSSPALTLYPTDLRFLSRYGCSTAIFAILTRLRQAVLHPTLVLKRLNLNIKDHQQVKRTAAEKLGGSLLSYLTPKVHYWMTADLIRLHSRRRRRCHQKANQSIRRRS